MASVGCVFSQVRRVRVVERATFIFFFWQGAKRYLLASSWDCTLRLYDTGANRLVQTIKHAMPVLDAAFGCEEAFFYGFFFSHYLPMQ